MSSTRQSGRSGDGPYYACIVGAALLWSTSFVGTKLAYATFPPITLGACRFVVASAVLAAALAFKQGFAMPSRGDLLLIALSGALGITLYFTMENIGVSMTSAANAALIVASYPAITTLLELAVYKIRPSKGRVIGIVLAVLGVSVLSGSGQGGTGGGSPVLGNVILIATGIVWAFYSFVVVKCINKYPALTFSFHQTLAGTLLFLPLALIERDEWRAPTPGSLAVLLYLGIFCSVFAFILYNVGLRRVTPGASMSLMNLVPVFGVLFSALLLDESVTSWQIGGGIVVVAGVFLSARRQGATEK